MELGKKKTVAYRPGEACLTEKNKVRSRRLSLYVFVAIVNVTLVWGRATITDAAITSAAAETYNSLVADPWYLDTDEYHIFYSYLYIQTTIST